MICTHSSYKPENASFWEDSIKAQVSETCWLFPHVLGITSLFFPELPVVAWIPALGTGI